MVLRASTQLVNTPKKTQKESLISDLYSYNLTSLFKPEKLSNFKIKIYFTNWKGESYELTLFCISALVSLCAIVTVPRENMDVDDLPFWALWSWALWLKLSTPSGAEHCGWSGALWMKLSALSEAGQCGRSDNDFGLLSEVSDSNLTGISLFWLRGIRVFPQRVRINSAISTSTNP